MRGNWVAPVEVAQLGRYLVLIGHGSRKVVAVMEEQKKSTTEKGNISLIKMIAACSSVGYRVSLPVGEGYPYDLVVDDGVSLKRCQVKTGQFVNGCVSFSLRSNNGRWYRKGEARTYQGKADVFGVYCPTIDQTFLVPIEDTGKSNKRLRIEPQRDNRNWRNRARSVDAAKYRLRW